MPDVRRKKKTKWFNIHTFPLKDHRTGEVFPVGAEVTGVKPAVLKSWERRGVVEKR